MKTSPNNLHTIILDEIAAAGGQISFAKFMNIALYHPQFGYYNRPQMMLGKGGDFTTAPEISPLFARTFARECASFGAQNILELGAGSGRFAYDFLQEMEANHQLPAHYFIYEISPILREKQQKTLSVNKTLFERVQWLEELPSAFSGILLANEVLDALPVHLIEIKNQVAYERCVTIENGKLTWMLAPIIDPKLSTFAVKIQEKCGLTDGYQTEIHMVLTDFVTQLSHMLQQGVMFFIDYGYGEAEYYHPERNRGTLTCFHQHRKNSDPLQTVGEQDITAHVNFTAVIESAADAGCELAGYTTQAAFLFDAGLLTLADQLLHDGSEEECFVINQAIKLLTFPTEMGERIKVMALSKGLTLDFPLPGFRGHDGRRSL